MANTGDLSSNNTTADVQGLKLDKLRVHISSFLPLIGAFSNVRVIGNQQILLHPLTDADWEGFRTKAKQVESFTFSAETEQDASQIATSSMLQIQAKLGTLPMFPFLRNLQIYVLSRTLVNYWPLLVSSNLRSVELTITTEDALRSQ
ncbi:hypothetical protein P691DRAFT_506682 [Macrolepiota fuliginosa MF-IS2]|uniref:Uncharacterized protein n=1 Tax=Macrolepiota fuliginosa MF-IS2 TaxID=1400762 RepID=A0A9P5X1Y0_9AGAR|nr:hypothetical protein P691DRAFT_506682 [Macrolepiota fuliginosa MF-IS2]